MISHQPPDYTCPFCKNMAGRYGEFHTAEDIVYEDANVYSFISPHWWESNPGHALVVPRVHHENIYQIPAETLSHVYQAVKRVAMAMRQTYGCRGISTRQNNEPSGGQDVWHLHVHVFPCHGEDNPRNYLGEFRFADAAARAPYARKLRDGLAALESKL